MNEEARLPQPKSEVLFTELADGTGVLLDLDTKFYYTLNTTGVLVWKGLAEESATIGGIAGEIARVFAVEVDVAAEDVEAIVAEMLADGLVVGGKKA